MDIRSLVRASYDPGRFSTAYHREKKALKQSVAEGLAAENAPPGSVAAANDPTKYGSAARQRFSNVFGAPDSGANPFGEALGDTPPPQRRSLAQASGEPTQIEGPLGGRYFGTTMPQPWLPGGQSFPGSTQYRVTSPTSMSRGTIGTASATPLLYRRPGGR